MSRTFGLLDLRTAEETARNAKARYGKGLVQHAMQRLGTGRYGYTQCAKARYGKGLVQDAVDGLNVWK